MLFGKKKRRIERILIVEDEPLVAFDNEHFLQSEGFDIVATVDSVADALRCIEEVEEPIHLLLVDIGLADGNGIDVARAASQKSIHVVFVTGACPGNIDGLALGCLSKPYQQRDLIAVINAVEKVTEGKTVKRLPSSFTLFAPAAA